MSSVVLPAPRKPDSTVTGSRAMEPACSMRRAVSRTLAWAVRRRLAGLRRILSPLGSATPYRPRS